MRRMNEIGMILQRLQITERIVLVRVSVFANSNFAPIKYVCVYEEERRQTVVYMSQTIFVTHAQSQTPNVALHAWKLAEDKQTNLYEACLMKNDEHMNAITIVITYYYGCVKQTVFSASEYVVAGRQSLHCLWMHIHSVDWRLFVCDSRHKHTRTHEMCEHNLLIFKIYEHKRIRYRINCDREMKNGNKRRTNRFKEWLEWSTRVINIKDWMSASMN